MGPRSVICLHGPQKCHLWAPEILLRSTELRTWPRNSANTCPGSRDSPVKTPNWPRLDWLRNKRASVLGNILPQLLPPWSMAAQNSEFLARRQVDWAQSKVPQERGTSSQEQRAESSGKYSGTTEEKRKSGQSFEAITVKSLGYGK
jgi:hypothetical protein